MAFTYPLWCRRDNNTPIVSHFSVNLFVSDPFERFEKLIFFYPATRGAPATRFGASSSVCPSDPRAPCGMRLIVAVCLRTPNTYILVYVYVCAYMMVV